MTITLNALQKQRRDTASNWTSNNTVLLAGELGYETDTKKFKIGDGSTAWQSLDYIPIPDTNRLLTGNLTVGGNFTVNGTTTTIDTTTLTVEDKNIEIGKVSTPSDTTADGGGITLKGATDKTINWVDSTDSWTLSEHLDLATGKVFKINNTEVLSATTLGSSVVSSSLTSVGTIATGVWNATAISGSKVTPDFGSQNIVTTGGLTVDTTTLHVDSSNNRVGIGTTSPDNTLDLGSSTAGRALTFSSYSNLFSEYSSGALWISSNFYGNAGASGYKTSVTGNFGAAGIKASNATGGGSNSGIIQFFTDDNTSKTAGDAFTPAERMRINEDGRVGIGEDSPTKTLVVSEDDSECVAVIKSSDTGTAGLYLGGQTDEIKGGILFNNNTNVLTLQGNNNATRAEIDTSGNFKISVGNLIIGTAGKGIDFSATSDETGKTSELLDDYEEGTFAPFFVGNTTGGSYGYASRDGKYTKVGQVVHFQFDLILNAINGAGTGDLVINNLPFTSAGQPYSGASIAYYINWNNVTPNNGLVNINDTKIYLYKNQQTGTTLNAAPSDLQSNTRIIMAGSYIAA